MSFRFINGPFVDVAVEVGVTCTIYIPQARIGEWADARLTSIVNCAGGYTIVRGTGVWKNNGGKLVEEEVVILSVVTAVHNSPEVEDVFFNMAGDLLSMGEEAVLYTIGHKQVVATSE